MTSDLHTRSSITIDARVEEVWEALTSHRRVAGIVP